MVVDFSCGVFAVVQTRTSIGVLKPQHASITLESYLEDEEPARTALSCHLKFCLVV